MIIKEKRWLSRIVAMLCVLTMVVGVLTPASVGVAVSLTTVTEIKIKLDDSGIEYYGTQNSDPIQYLDGVTEDYVVTGPVKAKIDEAENILSLKPRTGAKFTTDNITIYASSPENDFVLGSNNRVTVKTTYLSANGMWKVVINLSGETSANDTTLSIKKQYTVTYNNKSTCDIYDEDGIIFSSKKYDEGKNVKFNVDLSDEGKEVIVKSGVGSGSITLENKNTSGGYEYEIESINEDKTITISTIDKKCTVVNKSGENAGYKFQSNASTTVTYGGEYSFYVTPAIGYGTPTVYVVDAEKEYADIEAVEAAKETPIQLNSDYYKCTDIKKDKEIFIKTGVAETHIVSFEQGEGYTINKCPEESPVPNTLKVTCEDDIQFKIKAEEGYVVTRVSANNKVLVDNDGVYSLKGITEDTVISVAVSKINYKITYPTSNPDEGWRIVEGAKTATHGDFITFNVVPEKGYLVPTVKANGAQIYPIDSTQYRVEITQATTITVEKAAKETRKITFNDSKGYYKFSNFEIGNNKVEVAPTSVEYNDKIKFKVDIDETCNESTNYNVMANGAKLIVDEQGFYSISSITENQIITVEGVQKNTYTVTLKSDKGYTLSTSESTQVSHGSNFSFSWKVDDGYDAKNLNIADQDITISENNGNKTITVTKNIEISLDVEEKKYNVTIEDYNNDNADIKIVGQESYVEGGELTGIPYDGECSFIVDASDYYQIEYVLYNGRAIEPASNSVYTISNIRSDNNKIEIKTRENILTVNYKGARYGKAIGEEEDTEGSIKITHSKEEDIVLKDLSNSRTVKNCIYKFAGWTWEGNTEPTASEIKGTDLNLQSLIKDTDAEINVKAVWEVDDEAVKEGIQVRTGYKSQNVDNNVKLTFECILNLLEESIGNEHKSDVKITGYGIIYAATPITSIEDQIENVKERKMNTQEGSVYKDNFGGNMFNYFINTTLTLDQVQSGNSFRINSVVNKGVKRYGLAWMELTIGDEKIIIHGSSAPEQS